MDICIIATENYLYDSRMYWKEAVSLKNNGYNITCITRSETNKEEEGFTNEGIKYFKFINIEERDKSIFTKELYREYSFTKKTFDKILEIAMSSKFDVYHLHGLYSIILINKLKKNTNAKIIYEDREFYPDAIRDYNRTKGFKTVIKNLYSYYMDIWEINEAGKCDHIIVTDGAIAKRFTKKCSNKNIDIIYNFTNIKPIHKVDYTKKVYDMIYCGAVTRLRGIINLLQTVRIGKQYKKDIKLLILGPMNDKEAEKEIKTFIKENELESNVEIKGEVEFWKVPNYLESSRIGMVTLLPIPKYKKNIPIKQFEYMAYGLPIVGSDLPPIREFMGKSNTGILVNPLSPSEIWDATQRILNNHKLYDLYSTNGINAVKTKYNWQISEQKLIGIYKNLIKEN